MLVKNSLAPAVKCPNKSLTPSCFPTHPYNYINYQQRDNGNSKANSGLSSYNTSQSTMLTNQSNMSSLSNSQESSNKTAERKKPAQHQQLLDNCDTLSTHSFSSGKSLKRPAGPGAGCGENKKLIDLETVTPLYENLTDSIQIHESPMGGGIGGKFAIDGGQERYKISLRKPRRSSSRSNSAVSNSYYDCIKPIPAPRHRKYASTNSLLSKNIQMYSNKLDPIYMNLPISSGYETDPRANDEFNISNECPTAYDNQYFEITQHQTRILIPKELFPVDRSNQAKINQLLKKNLVSSNRRHIKLPLQKHHSFNFQSSQTVEATVRDLKIKSHSISSKTLRDYRNSSNTNISNNNNVVSSSSGSSSSNNNNNNITSSNCISSNSNGSKFPTSSTNPFINSSNTLTSSSSRRSIAAARQHTTLATATLATVRQHPSQSQSEEESSSDQELNRHHHHHHHHNQQQQQQQQQPLQHQQKHHTLGSTSTNSATPTVYKYETNSIAFKPITPVPTSTPAITNSKSSVNNMCKDKFAIK